MPDVSLDEQLKQTAASLPGIRLLVLFGSAAKGSDRRRSDVDVGIILEEPSSRAEVEIVLGRAAGRAIDIVDLNEAPPHLRFEIARDGKVLVERVPYAWANFRAKAMIDWWDWAPTARMIQAAAIERLRQRTTDGPA
jgi:predicted nucleotidyltransferase